jgi:broad specificity phosphatase PhoE
MSVAGEKIPVSESPWFASPLLPATVLLARHATPDWSRRDIPYDIPPGPPLTAQGEAEAEKLGRHLLENGVRKVYASPLVRTLKTAEIAAHICGATLAVAEEIAEWRRDENEALVLARMRGFWLRAVAESRTRGPITLVTHGGCVLALLNWLNVPSDEVNHYRNQFDHRNPVPPAGAWRTSEAPAGVPGLEGVRAAVAGLADLHAEIFAHEPGGAASNPLGSVTPAPLWEVSFAFSPSPLRPYQQQLAFV